jgi:hypothetical protein
MQNMFKLTFTKDLDKVKLSNFPIIAGILLIYLSGLLTQYTKGAALSSIISLTIIVSVQLLIYLFSNKIFGHSHWLYFGVPPCVRIVVA